MTRYQILLQFADDQRTHRNHAFTFIVLAEMWVDQGRPDSIELHVAELLRILDTKRSTLFRWLHQLESFGYIELRRAANQREKTTVRLTVAHAPNETARTEMRQQAPKWDSTAPNETAEPALPMPQMRQHVPKWDSTAPNETAESAKTSQKGGFAQLSTAAQPVLVHNNNHLNTIDFNNNSSRLPSGDDGKRVQGKNHRAVSKTKKIPFDLSAIADVNQFCKALQTEYPTADLNHYHARILNWRDKKGAVPERADWLSTAKTFLLNDTRDGKLVTLSSVKPPITHANRTRSNPLVEPQPDSNRRFGTW